MDSEIEPIDLCVPVYLNQQIVFDLLAILEDGFSNLSSIRSSSAETKDQRSSIGASIGGKVLEIVGVSLKADHEKDRGSSEQTETSKEKIHTPTSLFAKLRDRLDKEKLLVRITSPEEINKLKGGEFVELHVILKKNALVDTVEGIKRLIELAVLFSSKENEGIKKEKPKKGVKQKEPNEQIMLRQIDGFLKALTQSNYIELIGELADSPGARIVLSAQFSYFRDGNTLDVIDGEFYLLGKVTRVIKADSDKSINLLRNTSFRQMDLAIFDQFTQAMEGAESAGLNFPKIETEIKGPALQIVPIAIFT